MPRQDAGKRKRPSLGGGQPVHKLIKKAKLASDTSRKVIALKSLGKLRKRDPAACQPIIPEDAFEELAAAAASPSNQRSSASTAPADSASAPSMPTDRRKAATGRPEEVRVGALSGRRRKPLSQLERGKLKADDARRLQQEELAKGQKEKAEREKKIAQSEKLRHAQKKKMLKRNKKGQPLMKYRMEGILEKLQK